MCRAPTPQWGALEERGIISGVDATDLAREQRDGLWLDGHTGLYSVAEALSFLEEVGVALRYGATASLALASMYRATQSQIPDPEDEGPAHARAFDLTNGLLASGKVVEVNVIANRLVLAHERVMPAIYALGGAQSESSLSNAARQALDFIATNDAATSGDVRRLLKADGQRRPDAADLALSELQRALLVDRGPTSGPRCCHTAGNDISCGGALRVPPEPGCAIQIAADRRRSRGRPGKPATSRPTGTRAAREKRSAAVSGS